MNRILVTGAGGQLGQSIRSISGAYPDLEFIFTDREDLDITNKSAVFSFFGKYKPNYCINCAAYTQVDKAEEEPEKAYLINATGAKNLALACKDWNTTLIHISTDFVFDGKQTIPYTEDIKPNPLGVYGQTKLEGEKFIQSIQPEHYIVRTSWLYSEYAHNFVITILRRAKENEELRVVSDQRGSPTYARDLANFIISIVKSTSEKYGIYHFSNKGNVSWFDFSRGILEEAGIKKSVQPIFSRDLNLKAIRPEYSVFDVSKSENIQGKTINDWRVSLRICLKNMYK
jgi:dTDP-4-dehydrorhamnose reductase